MKAVNKRSDCPISYALDFFGDKWTLLIIRDMVFDKKRFYKEFLESGEGMATNILSDRLKKLESAGVIVSKPYEALKTRKEYSLTQKGKELIPVMLEMIVWSSNYDKALAIPPRFVKQYKTNRDTIIEGIKKGLG